MTRWNLSVLTLIAYSSLSYPAATFAQPIGLAPFGAEANGSVADCPSFCTNFDFGPSDGGPGFTSAATSFSASRGGSIASAALAWPTSTPQLRTTSEAFAGVHGASASAFASQGYTYNGPAKTLTLNAVLTGVIDDPDSPSDSTLQAAVALFEADGYVYLPDLGTILFESSAQVLTQTNLSDAVVQFFEDQSGPVFRTASLSFDVEDGDQFFLWTQLNAFAGSSSTLPGSVDAGNTFGFSFDDPTGLTPLATAVPEPSSAVTASLVVALISARRPRARTRR